MGGLKFWGKELYLTRLLVACALLYLIRFCSISLTTKHGQGRTVGSSLTLERIIEKKGTEKTGANKERLLAGEKGGSVQHEGS